MMQPLPQYAFRPHSPKLWDMARRGISDFPSVVPETILFEKAVQLPGPRAPLVVADPKLAQEVLKDRDGIFARDRFFKRMQRRAWGKGIAAAEGMAWQRQRQAAAPVFRPKAVQSNTDAFAAAAARGVVTWPTDHSLELSHYAARIIADIVFSVLIDDSDAVDTKAVAADVPSYIRRIATFGLLDMLPLPEQWHDRLRGIDHDPAVRRLRALAATLASRREDGVQKNDLIANLTGVGPIEDNILGLFPAAMETTVAAISWTLYVLAMRPEWQDRVAEEALHNDDQWSLERMPTTARVVREVLRMYPPAPSLIRVASVDHDLGGFHINKGQPVIVSIYAMHRHRELWDEPDQFNPDRFDATGGDNDAWMPFGAGPRVCIAAQFALTEIAVVVSRVLREVVLVPCDPVPRIDLQLTTHSATGLNVVSQLRKLEQ